MDGSIVPTMIDGCEGKEEDAKIFYTHNFNVET